MDQQKIEPLEAEKQIEEEPFGGLIFERGYWGPFGYVTEREPTNVLAERDDSVVRALCHDAK